MFSDLDRGFFDFGGRRFLHTSAGSRNDSPIYTRTLIFDDVLAGHGIRDYASERRHLQGQFVTVLLPVILYPPSKCTFQGKTAQDMPPYCVDDRGYARVKPSSVPFPMRIHNETQSLYDKSRYSGIKFFHNFWIVYIYSRWNVATFILSYGYLQSITNNLSYNPEYFPSSKSTTVSGNF